MRGAVDEATVMTVRREVFGHFARPDAPAAWAEASFGTYDRWIRWIASRPPARRDRAMRRLLRAADGPAPLGPPTSRWWIVPQVLIELLAGAFG